MGMYKHIAQLWKKPKANLGELWTQRLIEWRRDPSVKRLDNPTRIDRARNLGYKAKQGYVVVRVKLLRGGRKRPQIKKGRRSRARRRKKILDKSYQVVAEERANKKYPNCEVLNSYYVAKDGKHYWYEIILLDRIQVSKYKGMSWLKENKGRVYRAKTSSARKSRGLRKRKGKGTEKLRPSKKA